MESQHEKFKNKDIERQYQETITRIQRLIDAPIEDSKFLWDETVKLYATKIAQVQRVLNEKPMSEETYDEMKNLAGTLSSFLESCSSPEFQIALVGTIKAGKSTLINALLNYELASTRVTPETAALTKFKHASEDFVQISFYTPAEWSQLWKDATSSSNSVFIEDYKNLNADAEKNKWLNHAAQTVKCSSRAALKAEIERWTSSHSPCHYFVKEVLVGLKDFDLPDGIVLIDTPGLNDVVEFRSNITRHYIKQANAVLMCVKADSLTGEELQTLIRVFVNTHDKPEKVYVIATQIDTLNRPKNDWDRQLIEWTKYLKGENCYGNARLAQKNLVPVSAYLYTLLQKYRDNRISDDEDLDLDSILPKFRVRHRDLDARFGELEELTNIRFLYGKLQREVMTNSSAEKVDDIKRAYEVCKDGISKVMEEIKKAQDKLINDSQKGFDEISREREEKRKELEAIKQDKEELTEFVKQFKAATSKRVDEVVAAINRG